MSGRQVCEPYNGTGKKRRAMAPNSLRSHTGMPAAIVYCRTFVMLICRRNIAAFATQNATFTAPALHERGAQFMG